MSGKSGDDPHYFQFDLDRGIRTQVVEKLESSPSMPLAKGVGPNESGIYALYFQEKPVYIGKASKGTTKSQRSLRARLGEHVSKLSQRNGLLMSDVSYKSRRQSVPLSRHFGCVVAAQKCTGPARPTRCHGMALRGQKDVYSGTLCQDQTCRDG